MGFLGGHKAGAILWQNLTRKTFCKVRLGGSSGFSGTLLWVLCLSGLQTLWCLGNRDVRASTLEQTLRKLGVEKLGKDDVAKLPWESLEGKITSWLQYMRIAVSP
jgi:hypothetical protein